MRKRYGQSQQNTCPFCGKNATTANKQHVPVCINHKQDYLDLKCMCGSWLDIKQGKWGPYCTCLQCGNITFRKALEINPAPKAAPKQEKQTMTRRTPKKRSFRKKGRIEITSDDIDLFYS